MYELLKHTHLLAVTLSFIVFFLRGIFMMRDSALIKTRAALIVPHIINLILIVSGICLAVVLSLSPLAQPWLLTKIIALFVYIGLGIAAFKHPNVTTRKILWAVALLVFIYIASVAGTKNPLGFLSMII